MSVRFRSRRREPRKHYKLLSLLLQYPHDWLLAARAEIAIAVSRLPASAQKAAIERFCTYWMATEPLTLAQHYVETFDLQKRSSLYLSFYLYGDKRQRGRALLRLKHLYAAAGFVLEQGELPDYLPVMLEFAAFAPSNYGQFILGEHRPALEALRVALHDLDSPYAHLLDAICQSLPALTLPDREAIRRLIAEGPPTEQVGLEPFAPPEIMPYREVHR
jgi:nitrate reductase delta subunit